MKRVFSHYILAMLLVIFACQTLASVGERTERDPRDFSSGLGWGTSREEILRNRDRRKRQLRNLVNSLRKQLADHSAGEITLDPQKKTDVERRIDIFGRKLNMLDREPDDMVSVIGVPKSFAASYIYAHLHIGCRKSRESSLKAHPRGSVATRRDKASYLKQLLAPSSS